MLYEKVSNLDPAWFVGVVGECCRPSSIGEERMLTELWGIRKDDTNVPLDFQVYG